MRLGMTKTGWIAFRQQNNFVVHYTRKNPAVSLCRKNTPYHQEFQNLPSNAIFCHECLHSRENNARPAYARG